MADLVVFASGSGTNFEAVAGQLSTNHRVVALICDKRKAPALVRAERLGVPSILVSYSHGQEAAEERIASVLEDLQPAVVALAGFMRILSPRIVDLLPGSIVNVHPSLLPAFPGIGAIERSFAAGAPMGVTVHRVDHGVDTGQVLAQSEIDRGAVRTLEGAEAAIHELEHRLYAEVIQGLLDRFDAQISEPQRTTA